MDEYLVDVGDLQKALRAYACSWRSLRSPTTLTPDGLKIFEGVVQPDVLDYAYRLSKFGVFARGDRMPVRFEQQAYSSIDDHPGEAKKEFRAGLFRGLVVFTARSDFQMGPLMESKLAYVFQKDVADPAKTKVCYISDARSEVNERLDKDRHPKCITPRHQHISRRIIYWGKRCPNIRVWISKRGVWSAFKLIPVSIRSMAYMGCRFAGYMVVYLPLFFGWGPSPANWGVISTLLMQYIPAFVPGDLFLSVSESMVAYQYFDGGAIVEPWLGLRPWIASFLRGRALYSCLGYGAVNLPKKLAGGNCETRINLWGIEICTATNTFTFPPAKVDRAREFLACRDLGPGISRFPLELIQAPRRKMEHWSVCNQALCAEMAHIDRMLVARQGMIPPQGIQPRGHASIP